MKNTSLYFPLVDETIKLVRVVFVDNNWDADKQITDFKQYTYKCADDAVAVGDIVVVDARNRMSVARVVNINVPLPISDDTTDYKWVVQRLDMEPYWDIIATEKAMIEEVETARVNNMRGQLLAAMGLDTDTAENLLMKAEKQVHENKKEDAHDAFIFNAGDEEASWAQDADDDEA